CSIRAALDPSTRPPHLTRHRHPITVSHSMDPAHLSRQRRSHRSPRGVHPRPQRLHRRHSPVALHGPSDRLRAAPEVTGIPREETIRA
ncbi:hypothetical protein PIB30_115198, partial [Stylosanthes scabra]|nr:hypothetical protein [Stylosanthes scabra]